MAKKICVDLNMNLEVIDLCKVGGSSKCEIGRWYESSSAFAIFNKRKKYCWLFFLMEDKCIPVLVLTIL
jgi:hypothetical protein